MAHFRRGCMAKKKSTYFTSEISITFNGKTPIDANGNKEVVDMISKTAAAMIHAFKTTYPDITIRPVQNTTYSQKPLEIEVKAEGK